MSEYYAVQRSGNELRHYGVRGMKWGVRKAINRSDNAALEKHYKKAKSKLSKLNRFTDRKRMKEDAKSYAVSGVGAGLVSGGLGLYYHGVNKAAKAIAQKAGRKSYVVTVPVGAMALGAGALGMEGVALNRAIKASKSGNKRAVAKRDRFIDQMQKSFKGTKYAKATGTQRLRNYRPYEKEEARQEAEYQKMIAAKKGQSKNKKRR